MPPTKLISKSRYLHGLQCHKLLWYDFNAYDQIPKPSAAQQAIFDQGNLVGELARSLYPGGIEVQAKYFEIDKCVEETKKALAEGVPLFEAGFKHGGAFGRVDVLVPVKVQKQSRNGAKDAKSAKKRSSVIDEEMLWDIVEVKSSTDVKDVNLHDVSLQRYVIEGSGLKVRKCFVCHIDSTYVRRGDVDPRALLKMVDVTEKVAGLMRGVEKRLESMKSVVGSRKMVEVPIGPHCSDPYDCPLTEVCWRFLPEDSVFTLTRIGDKGFELLERGVLGLKDIGNSDDFNEKHRIQLEAFRTRKPFADRKAIAEFLERLEYPVHYLDFETFQTAVPVYDGVRPYQQVPFQFSLHIVRTPGGKPEHHSYLAEGDVDPRPEILRLLKHLLGTKGSIVAYNAAFEKGRLGEIVESSRNSVVMEKASRNDATTAKAAKDDEKWLEMIGRRFVDLLQPFREFAYYHPSQRGSASMKAVLGPLTGKGYDDLAIADGGTASEAYLRVTFGDKSKVRSEKEKIRRQLETYCGRDTEGMIWMVEALRNLIGG
jgi:RNase P/RNase MRP subunit p29